MDICLSAARAEASRRSGARSCGPKTPEGKARSAQNALKHGLRAEKFVVVGDEDPQAFAALEAALIEELAPVGALQGLLAARIARAAWRLERAERMEGELFALEGGAEKNLGLALVRDGNGSRAFDTLLRYRGTALAELWRALRLLKALQAEEPRVRDAAPEQPAPTPELPNEPEGRRIAGPSSPLPIAAEPEACLATARPAAPPFAPGACACAPAREATQKCDIMAQKCVTNAPPLAGDM
jgi:hypothetical protein